MNQNEKYNEVIVGICHDAALLAEIWGAFQKLFGNYVEEAIAALTPVAEALAGPILFGIEAPSLSEEEINRIIRMVDDGREQDAAPKKRVIKTLRCPLKASSHYNYIPRTPKNLPYQRRAY